MEQPYKSKSQKKVKELIVLYHLLTEMQLYTLILLK